MISKWDIFEISRKYGIHTTVDFSIDLQQKLLHEIKIMQPHKVTCSKCGNDVSYGKQFDPMSNDMLLMVNPCKCEER